MKKRFILAISVVLIATAAAIGVVAFSDRAYVVVSLVCVMLACLPFFIGYEKRTVDSRRLALLAAMTTISVIGRFIFAALPHFKPVSAMVIITGIYLGPESGFMCGALSAICSNILFGQGPWTPFQMLSWGMIGLFSGLFSKILRKNRAILVVFGGISGIFYSLAMDIWSTVGWEGGFSLARYAASVISALPVTAIYSASNMIFLFLLWRPISKKLNRMVKKGII